MRSDYLDSPYSWLRLCVSVVAGTIASVGMWAIVLVLPSIQAEFGAGRGETSVAYAAAMAGFGFGNIVLGRLVDRHGITPVLAVSGLFLALGFALSAWAQSIHTVAVLQFLVGFSTAAGFGPLIADLSHWFQRRRGIAVASAACGNYLAGAVWPQLLKSTLETEGWRAAFLVMAAACGILVPLLALAMRRRPPESDHGPSGVSAVFGQNTAGFSPATLQILLVIAGLSCCMAMAMPQVHIVAYCTDLGYGVTAGAQMLSTMLAAGIVSRLASGFVADYIGGVRTLLVGSVLQCLALFLYIPFNGLASLYIVSLVFGLSQGGIVPSYAIIVREFLPAREAGRRVGIVVTATVSGMALGGWMSGYIYDITGSYQAAFINGIGWNLLNIAIGVLLLVRARPRLAAA